MAKKRKHQLQAHSRPKASVGPHTKPLSDVIIVEAQTAAAMHWSHICTLGFVFLSIFMLYGYTLAPEIPTGDSGEFVTSAYLLGISHPTGYPLYNLLGKLFSLIPYGHIAWRINLSAAVCNTAACIFIYLTGYRITKEWSSALVGAMFFATSPIAWEYSLKAEVFALNNFFAAWILYLMMSLRVDHLAFSRHRIEASTYQHQNRSHFLWLLFVCGLALSNHHTIVLFAPGVLGSIWSYSRPRLWEVRTVMTGLALFCLGLSVYLYIPIRARAEPYLNWDDAKNWSSFIRLVTRADYGTFTLLNLNDNTYHFFEKCHLYAASLVQQFNPFGVILAVMGMISLCRLQEKKLKIILLVCYGLSSFVFLALANVPATKPIFLGIFERFYLLPNVLVAVFIGLGADDLSKFLKKYVKSPSFSLQCWSYAMSMFATITVIVAAYYHFPSVNQRENVLLYQFGRDILNSVEQDAVILTQGDISATVLEYLQQVAKWRPDLVVLCREKLTYDFYLKAMKKRYPTVRFPFAQFNMQDETTLQFVDANISTRPIYFVSGPPGHPSIYSKYRLMSIGLVQKVVDKNFWPNKENYIQQSSAIWQNYQSPAWPSNYPSSSWEFEINLAYALGHFNHGMEYQQIGLPDLALEAYQLSRQVMPENPSIYKNMGILYLDAQHNPSLAISYFKRYIAYGPKHDKDLAHIQELVKQYEPKQALETAWYTTHQPMVKKILGGQL